MNRHSNIDKSFPHLSLFLHSQGQFQSQGQGHEDSKHHYQYKGHMPNGIIVNLIWYVYPYK